MESAGRKRKASNATPVADGSASKKLKLLNSAAPKPSVQEVGQKIILQLQNAGDKTGRPIITEFLELPDRNELPEYYEFTKLPIAIETIQSKVKRNQYPNVSAIESDLKRMVQNAKDYNDPDSEIYQDAEKVRKLVYNFMKINNPAYKEDPKYAAIATPIPPSNASAVQNGVHDDEEVEAKIDDDKDAEAEEEEDGQGAEEEESSPANKPRRSTTARSSEPADTKSSTAPSATPRGADGANQEIDLAGKTFQEAQELIVEHLLHFTDDEGLEIYTPFGNLPSRRLEDYYKLIRHPVSIKGVGKRVRGIHGRAPPTGQTDFKNWDTFAEEVSYIWKNAREYNEDGSDMHILAGEFEQHVHDLLAEAREKVEEPSGPRLKIGGPKPKVMLNLSQSQFRSSPAPGVSIDSEALARQRQMVQAGVNGQQPGHHPTQPTPLPNGISRSTSQIPTIEADQPPSNAQSNTPPGTAVKLEKLATQSPGPNINASAVQPLSNGILPHPLARLSSGSPFPSQPTSQPTFYNNTPYSAPIILPPTQLRPYPLSSALLPRVTISTHPQLKLSQPLHLSLLPHPILSHQSATLTFPSTHYFLQISPTISKQLAAGRPYKMFVSLNGSRIVQRDTQLRVEDGTRTHVYEGSLAQGVNRVEVEVAAAREGDAKGIDIEKITVFANLMR